MRLGPMNWIVVTSNLDSNNFVIQIMSNSKADIKIVLRLKVDFKSWLILNNFQTFLIESNFQLKYLIFLLKIWYIATNYWLKCQLKDQKWSKSIKNENDNLLCPFQLKLSNFELFQLNWTNFRFISNGLIEFGSDLIKFVVTM